MTTRNRLTALEVTSRLRNSNNLSNVKFLQNQISEGTLNGDAVTGSTGGYSIIRTGGIRPTTGTTKLGAGADTTKEFTVNPRLNKFLVNEDHNPFVHMEEEGSITPGTKLNRNIPIGTFLKGETQKSSIDNITNADRSSMLKYLYVQAEMLKAARSRPEFKKYDIQVHDGIYTYEDVEARTAGDLADYGAYGRAISYTIKSSDTGTVDVHKTFKLAEYWSSLPWYDKIQVDYHSFVPGAEVAIRIFLILPELDNAFGATWGRTLETSVNLRTQSETLLLLNVNDIYG